METGDLPKKEFKVMIVKVTKKLTKKMDTEIKNLGVFNKELENIRNNQS